MSTASSPTDLPPGDAADALAPAAGPVGPVHPGGEPSALASSRSPADAPPAAPAVGQVLPIYFVGDESHSMAGAPIAAVNQGLADLRDEVAEHPLIGKKVRFGIVTFAAHGRDPPRAVRADR